MNFKIKDCDLNRSSELSLNAKDKFYTLVYIKSHASADTKTGLVHCKPGSFVIRDSNSPLLIKPADKSPLLFSLINFSGSDAKKVLNFTGTQFDIAYTPMHSHFADSIFGKISSEFKSQNPEWKAIAASYILELIGKILRLANHDLLDVLPDHAQRLRDLRADIHETYFNNWKIGEMAKKMGLSTSRFASLYKNEFKISPTEDLIQTRIDQSKKMLASSKVSIKKVSAACGFESVHYFHRAFKKRANITPKHFQNKQFANDGSVYTKERHFSLDRLTQQAEFSGIIEFIDGEIRFHGNTDHLSGLLGYPAKELREQPFINFVSSKDRDIAEEGVKKILSNKNIIDLSIGLVHQNGSIVPVEFSALLKGRNWFWFIKQESLQTL